MATAGRASASSRSCRRACCCRISPACRWWRIWPRCATRSSAWAAIPRRINPLQPVDLVIDHSVQVDSFGTAKSFAINARMEFERNRERYLFLRWGQGAFNNFRVVPPDTGIVHQVNLEYLAPVVFSFEGRPGLSRHAARHRFAYHDDQWARRRRMGRRRNRGRGRDARALDPDADSRGDRLRFTGAMRAGATATDLVLTVTQMLRKRGVVNKFVEYFGSGLGQPERRRPRDPGQHVARVRRDDRIFPGRSSRRWNTCASRAAPSRRSRLIEAYCKAQGLFRTDDSPEPIFTDTLELDLGSGRAEHGRAAPSAGSRAAARSPRASSAASWSRRSAITTVSIRSGSSKWVSEGGTPAVAPHQPIGPPSELGRWRISVTVTGEGGEHFDLAQGALVIAAITSCTNTSNPSVMLGAGLLAKKAVERGLSVKPWVKTSLAPGSKVVTRLSKRAGLIETWSGCRFNLVGYGCTTCIGNSGPMPEAIAAAVKQGRPGRERDAERQSQLRRSHQSGRALQLSRLAAAGGRLRDRGHDGFRSATAAAGQRSGAASRFTCATSGRRPEKSPRRSPARSIPRCSATSTAKVFDGDEHWRGLKVPEGRSVPLGEGFDVRQGAAVFRWRRRRLRRPCATSRTRACWRCSPTA